MDNTNIDPKYIHEDSTYYAYAKTPYNYKEASPKFALNTLELPSSKFNSLVYEHLSSIGRAPRIDLGVDRFAAETAVMDCIITPEAAITRQKPALIELGLKNAGIDRAEGSGLGASGSTQEASKAQNPAPANTGVPQKPSLPVVNSQPVGRAGVPKQNAKGSYVFTAQNAGV
ncbi:hypothetical protein BDW75DRAFT_243230 [Aspergillus navahoensis]